MTKRVISITLALIMLLGIFTITGANAEDIKILANKSLKVGQKADVSLTHPETGEKLNTIWESTNPSIATVTSDGIVKGLKAGSCTVYTYWNNKYYGVSVTVSGSSSSSTKKTSAVSAYTKLKNYLIKKGTAQTNSSGETIHYIKWENKKYRYWINYNSSGKYMEYAGIIRKDSSTDYGYVRFYQYESQNKLTAAFAWTKIGTKTNAGYYSKDYKKSKFNIKNKIKVNYQSGKKISNANKLANKYRKLFYPKWNKWLKKKVKVNLKSLGLIKSKTAKKISLNKKSAALKKGKTLKLKLKNAKASKVKWSSSKKKVATVSNNGKVKAKKKGKATIIAKYKGKKYKCKITVKAKKKASVYAKLVNYLKKNGTKDSNNYHIYWYEDGYVLWANYASKGNYVNMVIGEPAENPKEVYDVEEGVNICLFKSNKRKVQYTTKNPYSLYEKSYKKGTTVNTAKLKLKRTGGSKLSNANSRAREFSRAGISLWDKFLSARVGLNIKKLGFVYKQ